MFMQIFFSVFVALIVVTNCWKGDYEYTFEVNGRTLTGLKDVSNQYSGILLKANIIIYPQPNKNLMAKMKNLKYAQIHKNLTHWSAEIPDVELNYLDLNISSDVFEIVVNDGVITDVKMEINTENWEANIIKSIVSQFQLDTLGKNVISDRINQLPVEGSNSAVFKTMEETITGACETLYDISELPKYILQSQPWLVSIPEEKSNSKVIEIIKSKNFSNADERLAYYWGFGEIGHIEPNTNQMGDFFTKSSISRAIITGSLKEYTLQSSSTINEIILSPTLNSRQKGIVVSQLNVTLTNIKLTSEKFDSLRSFKKIGSLTYTFDKSPLPEENNIFKKLFNNTKGEEILQRESSLNTVPQSPLLPLFIGNMGKSIKATDKIDVISVCKQIARKIANEIRNPEHLPKNQTLESYVVLSSITRLMSEHEIETVANTLYTQNTKTIEYYAWIIFRDAIAESGTGPALLTIKNWIGNKKITDEEAAEVVSSMSQAARQPTEDYMRAFYVLATKDRDVTSQAILNDTAIFSYTNLVRKVYVDKTISHNQFPVHTFGNFQTEHGKLFVTKELIPHLRHKLNEAFKFDDCHLILVYIRALGNLGHQNILSVFEPYLEGERSATKFQRLQMVIALDKLVKTYPNTARSVLFKIYQNPGEESEIRVAAVYQLMRTNPPASMLQRMAKYTNIDTNQQVNAAVKTAITTSASLKGKEFYYLSQNARSAEHLLTQNSYGQQYSGDYLRSYVTENLDLFYKQTIQVYGSEDSVLPKGIKYAFRAGYRGIRRQLLIVQLMVSDVNDLVNIFKEQTDDFQRAQEEYDNYSTEVKSSKFSNEAIARIMGLEFPKREEFEGTLFFQILGSAARYFTFNTSTIEILPSILRELEDLLSEGYKINYVKFLNRYELAICFPTDMGLPFIYTMDMPTMVMFKGQIRATAEPKMSNNNKLVTPQTITAYAQLQAVISTKIQTKMGFITPFNHQQYISGIDRNLHINLPIKTQVEFDLKTFQTHTQIQPLLHETNTKLFHYSSLPYVGKKDILELKPLNFNSEIHIIYDKRPETQFKSSLGIENGIVFNVELVSEQKYSDFYWVKEQFVRDDSIATLLALLYNENIQYSQLSIEYDAGKSSAHKVQIRTSNNKRFSTYDEVDIKIEDFSKLSRNFRERQNQLVKYAGFKGTNVRIHELSIEFDGIKKVAYTASLARSERSRDNKSKLVFYMKKTSSNETVCKPLEIAFWAKTYAPRTNRFNFPEALNLKCRSEFEAKVFIGENLKYPLKIDIQAKFNQSESRKKYLKQHPRAAKCFAEMEKGNNALPNCANMTLEANLLNHMKLKIQYQNISSIFFNVFNLRYNLNLENGVEIETFIDDELKAINMTFNNNGELFEIEDIPFKALDKPIFVIHPDYSVWSRIMGNILNIDGFGETCVVDGNEVNTFDNKTYPLKVDNDKWVVVLHYTPRQSISRLDKNGEIYEKQYEQYSVLVRGNINEKRDVKVILRNNLSLGKLIELDIKSVDGECVDNCLGVFINNIDITDGTNNELVKVYRLPFGEIKIKIHHAFSIIYDGLRVLIEEIDDKFRGSLRGLCGSYSGDVSDDFLTPKNCIVNDASIFLSSYTLGKRAKAAHDCVYKNTVFANVISDIDTGVGNNESSRATVEDMSCVKYNTSFVTDGDEDCFTIRPLPVCNTLCSADKIIEKNIPVHCVKKSAITAIWKKQIENGANLDFSRKTISKSLKMKVPQVCTKY